MIWLQIVDDTHIRIFGDTPAEARANSITFLNTFVGAGNWVSWLPIGYIFCDGIPKYGFEICLKG